MLRLVFRFRLPIILFTVLLTLFFAWQLRHLRVESDVINYLPRSDPAVSLYHYINDNYGGNELALVAVEDSAVFSPGAVKRLAGLTEKLKAVPGITSVSGVADVIDIKGSAEAVEIGRLIDPGNPPAGDSAWQALKAYALSKKLYRQRLVSLDGKTSLLICQLKAKTDRLAVLKGMREAVRLEDLPGRVFLGGVPVVIEQLSNTIFSDLKRLIPTVTALILLMLFLSFGTFRGVFFPLLTVAICTIWTLGLMSLMHVPLTIISDVLPVIMVAVGTAPCIHIISKYDEEPEKRYGTLGAEPASAFAEVGTRVFLAEATTIVGFASFIFGSYMIMIREFGLFSGLGIGFLLAVAVIFIPAALSYVRVRPMASGRPPITDRITFLPALLKKAVKRIPWLEAPLFAAGLAAVLLSAIGIPRIERKVDMMDYFHPETEVRRTEAVMEERFGGSRPMQVLVRGDLTEPFVLEEMARLEKYMESLRIVRNTLSVSDLIAEMNEVMGEGKAVPGSRDKVVNLYFLLEGQEMMERLCNAEKNEGVITGMTGMQDVEKLHWLVYGIEEYLKGVDTALLAVNLEDLTLAGRRPLLEHHARRIASEIQWDIQARNGPGGLEWKLTPLLSRHLAFFALIPQEAAATSSVKLLADSVMALLPPGLQSDAILRDNIEGDLTRLRNTCIPCPARLYKALPEKPDARPRTVSFSMAHTGLPVIYSHLDESLLKSQVQSFAIAIALIFLMLAINLRSIRNGLIGLVPILITVTVMFGVMGFFGIPIDVATVLVASIAMGIGIDYTIHFNVRLKMYYRGPGSLREAIEQTLNTTGKAIIINALTVGLGFATLMFAELIPLKRFGLLVALTMAVSCLAALTVLPATLILFPGSDNPGTDKGDIS